MSAKWLTEKLLARSYEQSYRILLGMRNSLLVLAIHLEKYLWCLDAQICTLASLGTESTRGERRLKEGGQIRGTASLKKYQPRSECHLSNAVPEGTRLEIRYDHRCIS